MDATNEAHNDGHSLQFIVEAHVIPAIAVGTCTLLALSPIRDVRKARAAGNLGDLNPLPWTAMFFNAFIYVIYGLITSDWYIFISSAITMMLGFFYVTSAFRIGSQQQFCMIESLMYTIWLALLVLFAIASQLMHTDRLLVTGMFGSFFCVMMYATPLSTIRKVIRERTATSIHLPLAMTSAVNSTLWTTYGIAIKEPFLWGPIGIGMAISYVLVFLKLFIHCHQRAYITSLFLSRKTGHALSRMQDLDAILSEVEVDGRTPCPICLETMGSAEKRVGIKLACSHILCSPCATKCSASGLQTCPVCRHPHLLDPNELQSRNDAWRREYARWRSGKNRGAVGEITSITSPEAIAQGDDGSTPKSRQIAALDLASSSLSSKSPLSTFQAPKVCKAPSLNLTSTGFNLYEMLGMPDRPPSPLHANRDLDA